ncbi:MAG: F0F1 ATP synthase subunit A [Myxococcota bacterium]
MEHGVSWFSFLPGYAQLQTYFMEHHHGQLFNEVVVVQHVLAAALVMIIVLALSMMARSDIKSAKDGGVIPDGKFSIRNAFEVIFEALYNQMQTIIGGKETRRYFPLVATLALFIFFCNAIGLIPGFSAPTDNWNTTFACSILVMLYYNFHGFRVNGFAYVQHMANPVGEWWGWLLSPLFIVLEGLQFFVVRPFSLAVRLAANMTGDHAVLIAFLGLVPILVPLPFMFLGLFVSFVQTLVFVLLTIVYISLSVEEHHHDEHHGDAAHDH